MSNRTISLEPHSIGDLLVEVGCKYLQGPGLPSYFMKRVCQSFERFIEESEDGTDKDFARELLKDIEALKEDWSEREKRRYADE